MLKGKNILIGVCGSISAYKIPHLVRLFKKAKANVKVIITTNAKHFVSPQTLSVLSGNPVLDDIFWSENTSEVSHVNIAHWADILCIAPCSASQLAKLSIGLCDNIVTLTYLSARCPVFLAPAMDLEMYEHQTTRENIKKIESHHVTILEAEHGFLASGLVGKGRMTEPENIFQRVFNFFDKENLHLPLKNTNVLITAGPTQEAIDPVRYISNHSSGKMGYSMAAFACKLGANVTLISGPTTLQVQEKNIKLISIVTAEQMYGECKKLHSKQDICIFTAAVADFSPQKYSKTKIKSNGKASHLQLKKNIDIAHTLGSEKSKKQLHIGFALETQNAVVNAKEKLKKKNFDLVILNTLNDNEEIFGSDKNTISIFHPNKPAKYLPREEKTILSKIIFNEHIIPMFQVITGL